MSKKEYTAELCFKTRFDEFFFAYKPRNYEGGMMYEKEGKKLNKLNKLMGENDPKFVDKLCDYYDPFLGKSMTDKWRRDIDANGESAKSTSEDADQCEIIFKDLCK